MTFALGPKKRKNFQTTVIVLKRSISAFLNKRTPTAHLQVESVSTRESCIQLSKNKVYHFSIPETQVHHKATALVVIKCSDYGSNKTQHQLCQAGVSATIKQNFHMTKETNEDAPDVVSWLVFLQAGLFENITLGRTCFFCSLAHSRTILSHPSSTDHTLTYPGHAWPRVTKQFVLEASPRESANHQISIGWTLHPRTLHVCDRTVGQMHSETIT